MLGRAQKQVNVGDELINSGLSANRKPFGYFRIAGHPSRVASKCEDHFLQPD
jgi:hypothetical protein